jgi:hypothetical protein
MVLRKPHQRLNLPVNLKILQKPPQLKVLKKLLKELQEKLDI